MHEWAGCLWSMLSTIWLKCSSNNRKCFLTSSSIWWNKIFCFFSTPIRKIPWLFFSLDHKFQISYKLPQIYQYYLDLALLLSCYYVCFFINVVFNYPSIFLSHSRFPPLYSHCYSISPKSLWSWLPNIKKMVAPRVTWAKTQKLIEYLHDFKLGNWWKAIHESNTYYLLWDSEHPSTGPTEFHFLCIFNFFSEA